MGGPGTGVCVWAPGRRENLTAKKIDKCPKKYLTNWEKCGIMKGDTLLRPGKNGSDQRTLKRPGKLSRGKVLKW